MQQPAQEYTEPPGWVWHSLFAEARRSLIQCLVPARDARGGDEAGAAAAGTASGSADAGAGPAQNTLEAYAAFLFVRPSEEAVLSAAIAHGSNCLHSVAYEMVAVVLPYVNNAVGGNVMTYSRLRSTGTTLNLVGGLVLGSFADRLGPKLTLLTAHTSATLAFYLVSRSKSVEDLYLSVLPLVGTHCFQATLQAISMNSPDDMRARALGRVGAIYGAGFLVGSMGFALLSKVLTTSEMAAAAVAFQAAATLLVASAYPVPTNATEPPPLVSIIQVLRRPGVPRLLLFKVAMVTAASTVTSMVQQFAMEPFGFSARGTALLMTYIGGLQVVSQSLVWDGVPPYMVYLSSITSVGCSMLGMALTPTSPASFIFWLAPLSISYHAANTCLGSMLTLKVPREEQGMAFSLSVATMPAGQSLAFTIAAYTFHAYGFRAVPLAGLGLLVGSSVLIFGTKLGLPGEANDTDAEAVAPVQQQS